MTFAICLDNEGYEASLELRKIYSVVCPEANDPKGYIRIVDRSSPSNRSIKQKTI